MAHQRPIPAQKAFEGRERLWIPGWTWMDLKFFQIISGYVVLLMHPRSLKSIWIPFDSGFSLPRSLQDPRSSTDLIELQSPRLRTHDLGDLGLSQVMSGAKVSTLVTLVHCQHTSASFTARANITRLSGISCEGSSRIHPRLARNRGSSVLSSIWFDLQKSFPDIFLLEVLPEWEDIHCLLCPTCIWIKRMHFARLGFCLSAGFHDAYCTILYI
jgi:hypothetical protein